MIWLGEATITRDEINAAPSMNHVFRDKNIPLTDEFLLSWELIDDGFKIKWTETVNMLKEGSF